MEVEASSKTSKVNQSIIEDRKRRPYALAAGKFFTVDQTRYLYGGVDSSSHFNISNCDLKEEQFHYGIGREKFPALIEPEFISVEKAETFFADTTRFLLLQMDSVKKVYSIPDLTHHEVVNDNVNGVPIMAAYCVLADLGAIYDRTIDGKPYTFALSGYTYYDDNVWGGLDGFVMWDRETESLWWPLIGEGVSGKMKGIKNANA